MIETGEKVVRFAALPWRREPPLKTALVQRPAVIALLYLAGIASAELVTALVNPVQGIAFHVVLLFCLIFHSSFTAGHPSSKLYLALALAPLIRIVSLSMPLSEFSQIYWYFIVSIPLLIAILSVVRIVDFRPSEVGLSLGKIRLQGLVALTGIAFGLVEYQILRPDGLIHTLTWGEILIPALIFLVAVGFVQELAFRGVMQRSSLEALGPWGWVYIAGLFSVLHIGYLSPMHFFFVFLVGLFFGWIVRKTGSLLGVTLSHGITNISLYLVLPLIL